VSEKKNIILVIIDSLRQDHVGAYGNQWIKTPHLDAFCKEAARFDRAYPEALPTLPFRRSTFTGKRVFPFNNWEPYPASYPFTNVFKAKGLIPGWVPIPHEDVPMSEYLTNQGWTTGLVTDCFHQHYPGMNYHRGYTSWQFIRGQEYDLKKPHKDKEERELALPYMTEGMKWEERKTWELGRYLSNNTPRNSEEEFFAPKVFRTASDYLDQVYDQEEPFFLCVDCFDPHEPWDPPKYYTELYDQDYEGIEVVMPLYSDKADSYLTPEELRHMKALYAGEVTMVDRWFGLFMEKVKLLGLDKNTVICVVSDHGHQLGEKNFTGKLPWGQIPALLDIVLTIRTPDGDGAGKCFSPFVMNHDILPTLMNLAGEKTPEWCQGEDIWPVVKGEKPEIRDHVTSCFKDYYWVRDNEYALVTDSKWEMIELYDLKKDPEYLNNIASDNPQTVERMKAKLLEDAGGELPIHTVADPLLERK
jgi:arylsulfatase A-like enzyme